VTVLLATYAGERYLTAQLDSIAAQQDVDWQLLWRDDGSQDGTVAKLERFAAMQCADGVRRIEEPAGRLGAARSFLTLLAAAPDATPFLAFCDQDDVWLPEKLTRATAMLAKVPSDTPALYCARQSLVGPELEPRGLSPALRRPPGFGNALVQNIATGCKVVLNAAARRIVLDAPAPPPGTMHDWWCYLLVTAAGGRVLWDAEPTILYRQHGTNAVGATAAAPVRALRALWRGPSAFLGLLSGHLEALGNAACLTPDARRMLALLQGLREPGPLRRLGILRKAGLYRQGRIEDLLLRIWVALHRLPKP